MIASLWKGKHIPDSSVNASFFDSMIWAFLPICIVLASRLLGPEDIDSNDQAKQCLYVLDVWDEGHWILPLERGVLPATKPPLYTWIAVGTSALFGEPAELPCRLPSVAASLVVVWLIFTLGRQRWNTVVGIAAAWIFATSHTAMRLAVHVRPDMLLTVLTTAALYSLHRMEMGRWKGMHALFWGGTSLSILAKGPPGPLVIFAALLCLSFSRERRALVLGLFRSRWMCLLLVPLLWFVLAIGQGGKEYLAGTVWSQTFERAFASGSRSGKGQIPGQIFAIFAGRFAPWSILAFVALAGFLSRRASGDERRRSALFAAWTFGGLSIFGFSRGQREDYLLPMVPAASLLVASAMDHPPSLFFGKMWMSILATLALAGLLGSIIIAGAGSIGKPLEGLALRSLTFLAIVLLSSGLLFAIAGFAYGRNQGESGIRWPFFAAAVGMLLLMVSYFSIVAPDARSGRGRDLEEFASIVKREKRPDDEIRIFGPLANGIRFYTRLNQPESTREEIAFLMTASDAARRLLVITNSPGAEELMTHGPGAPEVLARRRHGDGGAGLVLLHMKQPEPR